MKDRFYYFWLPYLILFAGLSFTLSCTRSTNPLKEGFKDRFAQGTDDNLIPIDLLRVSSNVDSDDDNPYNFNSLKESISKLDSLLKIKTVSNGEKVKISAGQKGTGIDPKVSFRNEYEILDYTIGKSKTEFQKKLKSLLGKVEFHGFPDTEYYIAPHFEKNYLILYKVGRRKDIPYDELPLGVAMGDHMAVPLVGYPIKYCKGEVKLDNYNQETGLSRPACEGISIKQASYIFLYTNTKQEFEYLPKLDHFPKGFFKGKWFYVRTIVKSPEKRDVGHRPFEAAHLVEFHPLPDKLEVRDASGYNFEEEDKVRAFFIPIERQDYRIKKNAENIADNFEEELKEKGHDVNRPWFTINFDKLVENEIEFEGEKSIKNPYVSNDYVSFDVEIAKKGSGAYLLTYAFRKAVDNPDYVEKQWFEEDSSVFFPMFAEKRKYYKSATDHTQQDNDRFFRTTRFDPKKGEIKWYFSKQTSKEDGVRDIGRQAVFLLNRAFELAGKGSKDKIKITLDEGEDKDLGDIRYNVLNMIVSESEGNNLFGLGPNVANPITGEAISATANIWVSSIVDSYVKMVRNYIRFHIYPPAWKIRPSSYGVSDFLHERIQKNCPEVADFICSKVSAPRICESSHEKQHDNLQFHPKNPPLQDKKVISSCAHKISRITILGTTLHEMLHGVGLRHVFSASADKDNFYKTFTEMKKLFGENFSGKISLEKTKSHPYPPRFSSVMDYFALQHPILFVPGKLDIAALRFIYFDKVEKIKGGFLKVPSGADRNPENPQKSILKTLKDENLNKEDLKLYKICGGKKPRADDFSYGELNPDDPLCARFDYGTTPREVVETHLAGVNRFLMVKRNRYDSEITEVEPEIIGEGAQRRLNSIYQKWASTYRDPLLLREGKALLMDYTFLNEDHVKEYKRIIEEEAEKNPDFKEYYEARQPIFDYIKEIAFLPVKHCIYKGIDNSYKAVALENIEEKIIGKYAENSRELFVNCKSSIVQTWANENDIGKLITEVGFFGKHRKYLIRPKDEDPIDEKSVFDKKASLADKLPENPLEDAQKRETFWAKLIDPARIIISEPDFGAEYFREMSNYILYGMDFNPYIDETAVLDEEVSEMDIPRNKKGEANLPRFLSYKIDTKTVSPITGGLFEGRQIPIIGLIVNLTQQLRDEISRAELHFNFLPNFISLIDMSRYTKALEENPILFKDNYPFFDQVYTEYKDKKSKEETTVSLLEFIKRHPSVLQYSSGKLFGVPHSKDSYIAHVFQKFNEYSQCVQEHQRIPCEKIDEKKAFIKVTLDSHRPAQ